MREVAAFVQAYRRGHPVRRWRNERRWRWAHSGRFIKLGSNPDDPPCVACGKAPLSSGADACLGWIDGAQSACCGHGVVGGHVKYPSLPRVDLPPVDSAEAAVGKYRHVIPDRAMAMTAWAIVEAAR